MATPDPQWPPANNLLGKKTSSLALVGVPVEASISPSRAQLAPKVVRRALGRYASFDSFTERPLTEASCHDLGDLAISGISAEEKMESIKKGVADLASANPLIQRWLFIGGDNALTRPCLGGLFSDLSRVGLLTFDAHHDVRSFYRGVSNGTPVRGLIEDGLSGENIVQVGLGRFTNSADYYHWSKQAGITLVTLKQIEEQGIVSLVGSQLERLSARTDAIYVDVDLDVLDSVYAPGCPGARPGGLTPGQLSDAIYQAALSEAVAAFDFVEFDPSRDRQGQTALNMAQALLTAISGSLAGDFGRRS